MTIWVVLGIMAVLACLALAAFFMLQSGDDVTLEARRSKRMARALALRVGVSIAIFASLWLAYAMGWIQPNQWVAG